MAVVFDAEVAVNNIPVEAAVESNLVDLVPGVDVIIDSGGGGGGGNVQASKSVSYTPSETAISDTVQPDEGYDSIGEVNVSVGAISSTYVGSDVPRRASSDLTASGRTVTVPQGYYAIQAAKQVASGAASTPATTIMANPTISVSSSGLITASVSGSQSVTPSVSAGYVSSGTAGTVSVSGSATSQLPLYDGS